MTLPVQLDITYLNTAIVLALGGLVVHWIRRVNKILGEFQHLPKLWALELERVKQELYAHIEVTEVVCEQLGKRVDRLEGWRPGLRGN